MRFKAIYYSIIHGLLPWWCYEDVKHYDCSYLQHLWINVVYAFRWFIDKQTYSDIKFEIITNDRREKRRGKRR